MLLLGAPVDVAYGIALPMGFFTSCPKDREIFQFFWIFGRLDKVHPLDHYHPHPLFCLSKVVHNEVRPPLVVSGIEKALSPGPIRGYRSVRAPYSKLLRVLTGHPDRSIAVRLTEDHVGPVVILRPTAKRLSPPKRSKRSRLLGVASPSTRLLGQAVTRSPSSSVS